MDLKRLVLVLPPPLVYVVGFGLGIALERAFPLARAVFAPGVGSQPRVIVAGVLMAFGFMLGPINAVRFVLKRTTLNPIARPTFFMTEGWYQLSRNPMYLGFLLIYVGMAISRGLVWPLATSAVPFLVMDHIVIPAEESAMRERFGAAYAAYCTRVARWLTLPGTPS